MKGKSSARAGSRVKAVKVLEQQRFLPDARRCAWIGAFVGWPVALTGGSEAPCWREQLEFDDVAAD